MTYTHKQAARDYIRDLVIDIRCARRDGMPDYASTCERQIHALWTHRHGTDRRDIAGVLSGALSANAIA